MHFLFPFFQQDSRNTVNTSAERITHTLDTSRGTLEYPANTSTPTGFTSEERVGLQAKLLSLEVRWAKLQWECEGRNMRLETIHQLLTGYERAVAPFMVTLLFSFHKFLLPLVFTLLGEIFFCKEFVFSLKFYLVGIIYTVSQVIPLTKVCYAWQYNETQHDKNTEKRNENANSFP